MMEFTYDGMVRLGYGFYNPNHAAALICALLPFLWEWCFRTEQKLIRIAPILLTLLLTAALIFTFSRTGIAVMILEALLYGALKRKINWKWIGTFAVVTLILVFLSGVWMRFRLDGAVMNRPKIWLAGLQLFAANPLGVGGGNSGKLATAFLLPDGIQCRTLVNSHLTFLVEYGIVFGFIWFAILLYALSRGIRKTAFFCSLVGLAVSALSASVFDPGVLFDFQSYGDLPLLNFILSWGIFLLYFALIAVCSQGKIQWKKFVAAVGLSGAVLLVFLLFQTPDAPHRKGEYLIREGSPMTAVLYDGEWKLREIRAYLENGWILPLKDCCLPETVRREKIDRIYLFGEMSTMAKDFPEQPLYFICPPDYAEFPENLKGVFLPAWSDNQFLLDRLNDKNIPCAKLRENGLKSL